MKHLNGFRTVVTIAFINDDKETKHRIRISMRIKYDPELGVWRGCHRDAFVDFKFNEELGAWIGTFPINWFSGSKRADRLKPYTRLNGEAPSMDVIVPLVLTSGKRVPNP